MSEGDITRHHPTQLPDGIYFGLDETEYHAQTRFSSSGIKAMKESPDDFWYESWMNDSKTRTTSPAMELGTAMHKRILEGETAFNDAYYVKPNVDDANYLVTSDDIKAALKAADKPVSGTKSVLIDRLVECRPELSGLIWDVVVKECEKKNAGKIGIDFDTFAKIEEAAAMVSNHNQICKVFEGGSPEVSILWTGRHGIPMKCRLDYMHPGYIADLKSFSNKSRKDVDHAIYREFAAMRHHIQAAVYWEAVQESKKLQINGEKPAWWDKFLKNESDIGFIFVYLKTNGAPVVRGKQVPNLAMSAQIGQNELIIACETYAKFWDTFGAERWIEQKPIEAFDDDGIPPWAYE